MKLCIMCGVPTAGSMDGPYICGRCDCGIKPDGKPFTLDDAGRYYHRIRAWRGMAEYGQPDHKFEPLWEPPD